MQKLMIGCLASLALGGCGKHTDSASAAGSGSAVPAAAANCASVVNGAIDRVMPDMTKDMNLPADKVGAVASAMKGVLISHCTADQWPADYVTCLGAGTTTKDMDACDAKLGKDKKDKMDDDLGKAMEAVMGEGAMAGGSGAMAKPADGSASGSATSAAATDCASVVGAAIDRARPDITKDMDLPADKVAAVVSAMKGVLISHCTSDQWSADYVTCLGTGKTMKDMDACDAKLSKAQSDKMNDDLGKAVEAVLGEGAMSGGSGSIAKPADRSGSATK